MPPIVLADDDPIAIDTDCNCACPSSLSRAKLSNPAPDASLHIHPQLQHITLSPTHSVVFVPSGSSVAVLNVPALKLLQNFAIPRTLDGLNSDGIAAARQLYHLRLLQMDGDNSAMPMSADQLIAWFHVTNACDLRCTYCYLHKTDEVMSDETGTAAVDAVLRAAQLHGYRRARLKYAGGEATLNLALVEHMQRYAVDRARNLGIALEGVVLSNGVGMTNHKLSRIQELGLQLMISLDGPRMFHNAQRPTIHGQGSFDATLAGIARAQSMGLNLTISVTVTGSSIAGLPEIVAWLLDHELHFTLNFYRDHDCSDGIAALRLDEQPLIEGMRAVYREIAQHPPRYSLLSCLLDRINLGVTHQRACAVGENYLVIDQHGNIAKCQMEITRPVTTIHTPDPLLSIRLKRTGVQNLPVDQKEGCRDCAWRYWCAGGCSVATFHATGRYDVKSPNCAIYQALYPDVLRLEGLRLLYWATGS